MFRDHNQEVIERRDWGDPPDLDGCPCHCHPHETDCDCDCCHGTHDDAICKFPEDDPPHQDRGGICPCEPTKEEQDVETRALEIEAIAAQEAEAMSHAMQMATPSGKIAAGHEAMMREWQEGG